MSVPLLKTLWSALLGCLNVVCTYKNIILTSPFFHSVFFSQPSSTGWKEWPEGGHLYLLPLLLVLVVRPVGHLVTWNQVSGGVIAQIDVKGCASNGEASFLPRFALSHSFRNTSLGNRWLCKLAVVRCPGGSAGWHANTFSLSCRALQTEHTSRKWRFDCG